MKNKKYICPVCNGRELMMKYEAKYVYSYVLDDNAPGLKNVNEFLPFMYDKREQLESNQFVECNKCKTRYPYVYGSSEEGIDFNNLQKVITLKNATGHSEYNLM